MKTDSIWYQLFLKFPGYFFELIGKPSTDSLRYKFGSVEVKELSFRLDGVFLDQIRFGLLSPSPPLVPPTGGETGGGGTLSIEVLPRLETIGICRILYSDFILPKEEITANSF